jgi:AcrR family transcriptional regulator
MLRAMPSPAPKRSEARDRVLAAASHLFYAEGITSVGIDRIVKAAPVTLATLYRHFPTKEDLVVAYLEGVHALMVERATALTAGAEGRDVVRALRDDVAGQLVRPGFRGCAFINAASEFQDPESAVRQAVAAHRQWYFELIRRAFGAAGHARPGGAARHFVMLRDGAMSAAYLDTATAATRTFRRGVDGLVASIDIAPLVAPDGEDDA